jgi:hypothetical protein
MSFTLLDRLVNKGPFRDSYWYSVMYQRMVAENLYLVFRIRIQLGLEIRIRIKDCRNDPQKEEKVKKFHVLKFCIEG